MTKITDFPIYQTLTLAYPIVDGTGKTLTKLTVRRAKVGDLRSAMAHKEDAEQELFLFARLTGLTFEDIEELDATDYDKLQACFKAMREGK